MQDDSVFSSMISCILRSRSFRILHPRMSMSNPFFGISLPRARMRVDSPSDHIGKAGASVLQKLGEQKEESGRNSSWN